MSRSEVARRVAGRAARACPVQLNDIRFLLEADDGAEVVVSRESHDVRWVALEEVAALNTDESVLRLVAKTHGWTD